MKYCQAVLVVGLSSFVSAHALAQESLSFSLSEVDSHAAPARGRKHDAPANVRKHDRVDLSHVIPKALGALHWGMSRADLLKVLRAQIRAEFEQRIKVERDIMQQDSLYQQAQERYRRINENYVEFNGIKTGWDVSPIASEFSQGIGESMLVVDNAHSRDLYFFMQGKLWKWYRELTPEKVGADAPAGQLEALTAGFGDGEPQQDRVDSAKTPFAGTTWSDGRTRVTALHRGRDACLVFEDTQTVQRLAKLRHEVQSKDKGTHAERAVEWALAPASETEDDARP